MDRFIFHNSQYKILDTVRDMPWVGVPLPFAECIFYFADMGLQVSTAVCKSRTCLSMCFAMISDGKPVVFASVNAALNNGRWPRQIDLSFVSGRGAPPESIYEFIRFYQRLSIYLAQPKPKRQVSEKEVKAKDLGMAIERKDEEKKEKKPQKDRIISLAPLSELELRQYAPEEGSREHKKQEHPCDYAYWVRGHNRIYRSGLQRWIEPHMRNSKFPERSRTYTLKEDA